MLKNIKGISLFSSAGIGEMYLKNIGITIVTANEIIDKRAKLYKSFYPNTNMIVGDIREQEIFNRIANDIRDDTELLIATPPCQGLSTLGKNKSQAHLELDERNYLIFNIFKLIDIGNFNFVFIENVPRFLKMFFPYKKKILDLETILKDRFSSIYNIEVNVLNAKDYGVPQTRPRAIIKMYKRGFSWENPKNEKEITLKDTIYNLPSLKPGETSDIPWHSAKPLNERIIESLRHTPTGCSALNNKIYYPKKSCGEKIKGFHNTYKRMSWDQPAHARTTYSGSVSSHNNVHPGRLNNDGTYSDPRVLSMLETFIVSSMPLNPIIPEWVSETFLRTLIGESIPPLMMMKILSQIKKVKND